MDWPQAREPLAAPIFAPFADAIAKLPRGRWPTHDDLTQAAADVVTSHGRRVRFAAPRAPGDRDRRSYELRIAETGEIETRTQNWHDLFNALVWIAFPGTKAAINAQHAAILEPELRGRQRGHAPHRLFQRKQIDVAHVVAEHARERAPQPRVRMLVVRQAVGTDHGVRIGQHAPHVVLAHHEVDGAGR